MRFSEHFGLNQPQSALEFVDVPLHTDITLFLDPNVLAVSTDPWFVACAGMVRDYFDRVVSALHVGDAVLARGLLGYLHEPNDTRLGYSADKPAGRGLGDSQAQDLYTSLAGSAAVRTGNLRDIADCDLIIPGIGRDKISDMTTNIIRSKLIEFTQQQCRLWGVPMQPVAAGHAWDPTSHSWRSTNCELPVGPDGRRILLVPKRLARIEMTKNRREYHNLILDHIEPQHMHPGDALARVLRNGRVRVWRSKLRKMYPANKGFLLGFTQRHPELLERYTRMARLKAQRPLTDEQIDGQQPGAE